MILSLIFLFLVLLTLSASIYYLFVFFIPALKLKYTDYNDALASDFHFSESDDVNKNADLSKIAVILNNKENKTAENRRMNYEGEKNCELFHKAYVSEFKDEKICLGFGDCVDHCPQSAIIIKNEPEVIASLCNGCGRCIDACPAGLISLKSIRSAEKQQVNEEKSFKFWAHCYKLISRVRV